MTEQADSDRVRKILEHPLARGREPFARYLALQTGMTVKESIGALEACAQDDVNRRVRAILDSDASGAGRVQ
jgi:hypothetical protein